MDDDPHGSRFHWLRKEQTRHWVRLVAGVTWIVLGLVKMFSGHASSWSLFMGIWAVLIGLAWFSRDVNARRGVK